MYLANSYIDLQNQLNGIPTLEDTMLNLGSNVVRSLWNKMPEVNSIIAAAEAYKVTDNLKSGAKIMLMPINKAGEYLQQHPEYLEYIDTTLKGGKELAKQAAKTIATDHRVQLAIGAAVVTTGLVAAYCYMNQEELSANQVVDTKQQDIASSAVIDDAAVLQRAQDKVNEKIEALLSRLNLDQQAINEEIDLVTQSAHVGDGGTKTNAPGQMSYAANTIRSNCKLYAVNTEKGNPTGSQALNQINLIVHGRLTEMDIRTSKDRADIEKIYVAPLIESISEYVAVGKSLSGEVSLAVDQGKSNDSNFQSIAKQIKERKEANRAGITR